jgi:hypothetical protein
VKRIHRYAIAPLHSRHGAVDNKHTDTDLNDKMERLEEIKDQIKELAWDAHKLIGGSEGVSRTWYASIISALDADPDHVSREPTLQRGSKSRMKRPPSG